MDEFAARSRVGLQQGLIASARRKLISPTISPSYSPSYFALPKNVLPLIAWRL